MGGRPSWLLSSGCESAVGLGRVSGSMVPSLAEGLRFSSNVPGGWMGSYSSVASLPESWRMILEPPGWEGRNSVTWRSQSQHL